MVRMWILRIKRLRWPWVARRRLLEAQRDAEMSWDCLGMIHEVLDPRIDMSGCPPMFYPEAIVNIANLPRRAIMRALSANEATIAKATEDELVEMIRRATRGTEVRE